MRLHRRSSWVWSFITWVFYNSDKPRQMGRGSLLTWNLDVFMRATRPLVCSARCIINMAKYPLCVIVPNQPEQSGEREAGGNSGLTHHTMDSDLGHFSGYTRGWSSGEQYCHVQCIERPEDV